MRTQTSIEFGLGLGLGLGLGINVKEVTGCNSVPHVSSHRLPRRTGVTHTQRERLHISLPHPLPRDQFRSKRDVLWGQGLESWCCHEWARQPESATSLRARLVDVWRQKLDMSSFWIRPEYVVDYRPILDVPVDAAGEVVHEIMLCCCCIR